MTGEPSFVPIEPPSCQVGIMNRQFTLAALDSFIKTHLGNMCYVSDFGGRETRRAGIGIITDRWSTDPTPHPIFTPHPNLFFVHITKVSDQQFIVIAPGKKELDEAIEEFFKTKEVSL